MHELHEKNSWKRHLRMVQRKTLSDVSDICFIGLDELCQLMILFALDYLNMMT